MQNGIPVGLRSSPSFGLSRSGQLTAIIQSLFWDGSQGWWYDDNDTTTLFQDSAGTTPVTAVEQFVGLQLDKSKGLVLGPELVPATYSGVVGGLWAISATAVTRNGSSTNQASFNLTSTPTANKHYQVVFTVSDLSGDTLGFRLAGGTAYNITANGTYTFRIISGSAGGLTFIPWAGTAGQATITNISVRELTGNHRYAPASGNRPIWSKRVNLLTKTEQFNDNAVWESTITGTGVAATVTADQGTAPDGTNTADRIQFNLGGGTTTSDITRRRQLCVTPATAHTFSLYLRSFDGVSSYNMHIVGADGATTNIVVTGAWQRFTVTANGPGGAVGYAVGLRGGQTPANSNTADILAWGADARPANQATGLLPIYQRVNTSSDYDTNGFPGYLKADGVDDFLQTNSIDFNTVTSDGQARRNLLVNPTQFDASGWTKSNATVTANVTTAPDGTNTAYAVVEDVANTAHGAFQLSSLATATTNTFSFYLKANTRSWAALRVDDASTFFDLGTGAVGTVGSGCTASIQNIGSGWYRCVVIKTWGSNQNCWVRIATGDGVESYTGDGTSGIYIWGAQLETGSTATAFQNIGTDKITLCAGLRKLSDAARAAVTELSATIALNNGTFLLAAPDGATNTYGWDSKGTTQVDAVASSLVAPLTNVVTGIGNISGDSAIIRVNGVVADTETGDQGTGNYGNYPAYFFHRNTSPATLRFNGNEYGNIAVGKLLTADQLTALETYMNGLTRAY